MSFPFRWQIGILAVVACGLATTSRAAEDPQVTFKSLFGDQIRQVQSTTDSKDDAELGAKFLESAKSVSDTPALQILLFEKAYEFALKHPSGLETAVDAMKQLAAADPARAAQCEQKILDAYQAQFTRAKGEEKSAAAKLYFQKLMTAADDRMADKKFDDAEKLYRSAISAAAAGGRASGDDDPAAKLKDLQAFKEAGKKYEALIARFDHNPADTVAARQLAQHCLIELREYAQAAKYAQRAGDESFAKLVTLAAGEAGAIENAQDAADLGDLFKRLADTATTAAKPVALARSKAFYERFLTLHPSKDAARLKAEMALSQIGKTPGTSATATLTPLRPAGGDGAPFNWKDLPKYSQMTINPKWEQLKVKTTLNAAAPKESLTLTKAQSPYLVTGTLFIDEGLTLEIQGGVTLLFAPDARIQVKGTLRMSSEDEWIVLAPARRAQKWEGIFADGPATASRCLITGARAGITVKGGKDSFHATQCIFAGNDKGVANLGKATGGWSNGDLADCLFYRNDVAVNISMGRIDFAKCLFLANTKHAVNAIYYGSSTADESTFAQNGTAIQTAELECVIKFRQCNLVGNTRQAVGDMDPIDLRENFWGKDAATQLAAGKSPGITGKVTSNDWLKEPVQTAFPNLPKCEFLIGR